MKRIIVTLAIISLLAFPISVIKAVDVVKKSVDLTKKTTEKKSGEFEKHQVSEEQLPDIFEHAGDVSKQSASKVTKTSEVLDKIKNDLALRPQTEATRKKAVEDYRDALNKASTRTYDIKTILDFLTPTGGLLDTLLKTKDISEDFISVDFMDDVNIEDLINFAQKVAILTGKNPAAYDNFYTRFMQTLAGRALQEKQTISTRDLSAIESLLNKLPEKEVAIYAQWLPVFIKQGPAAGDVIARFVDNYANALYRAGSVSALAEGIEFLRGKVDPAKLRSLQLRMLQGAERPDFMTVISPKTRASIVTALDDLARSKEGVERTTISSVVESINNAIADLKTKNDTKLKSTLDDLRAMRTVLIQKLDGWKDHITTGKETPRFMRDFLRKDEAFLNQALFGRAEKKTQDIMYQSADDFIDSLQALSAYMQLYPEKGFSAEHAFLQQEALKRFLQPSSSATKSEVVQLVPPMKLDAFKSMFPGLVKPSVFPDLNASGEVTEYQRITHFPNKFALLVFWDGTPKERNEFIEKIGNDAAVVATLHELFMEIPTLTIPKDRLNELKQIAVNFAKNLIDSALNQAAAFNNDTAIRALPISYFNEYLEHNFTLHTESFAKNLNDIRFLNTLTDEQFDALVTKMASDVSQKMTQYVTRVAPKVSSSNIKPSRKQKLQAAIAQHQKNAGVKQV